MATTTTNLGLRKPATSDTVNVITDISDNADLIDAKWAITPPTAIAPGDSAAAGSTLVVARADHRHSASGWGSPVAVDAALSDGTATTYARSDHVHTLSASLVIPTGLVAIWPSAAAAPSGWALWTDSAGRLLIGANGTYVVTTTGGADSHTHTVAGHTHNFSGTFTSDQASGEQPFITGTATVVYRTDITHTHPVTIPSTATSSTGLTSDSGSSLPPWYATNYIQKS